MMWTPEIAAGIGSVAGALLFFGAGFLLARFRMSSVPARADAETKTHVGQEESPARAQDEFAVSSGSVEQESLLLENEQLRHDVERRREENLTIINAAKAKIAKMKMVTDKAKAEVEELRRQLADTGRKLAEALSEKSALTEELHRDKEGSSRPVPEVDLSEIEARERELALRTEQYARQSSYIAELEDKNRDLVQQVDRFEEELARLSDLEGADIELSIRTQRLDEQQKDLDTLRDENRSLQANLAELEASRREIARLKEENAKLTSLEIVHQDAPVQQVQPNSPDGLGGAFQNMVNELSREKRSRGVVLADELGLLVAGTGEHTEPMAAMAAVFSTVNERLGSIFPLGPINQIVIENMDELTITMQPYEIAMEKLVLTALTVGPGPNRQSVAELIERNAAG